jgi:outer membrane protein OmpA-like peptidoglycan-associated protein
VTKEEDFNLQNNAYTITFKGKDTPNAYNTTLSDNRNGVLRVAVYDEPGLVARDVKIQLFPSGSNQPLEATDQNPKISILPFDEYDVNVKSAGGVEHWIRGVPVAPASEMGYQGAVSLDIMLQKIEGTIKSLNGERSGSEIIFSMPSEILFHTNEYEINLYAEDYLKRVRAVLNAYPESTLIIEGHTDALGNEHDNLVLSERRANEVKKWLIEKENIEASRLKTVGLGASVPIADNTTAEGRMKNRRVKFKLQLE